MAQEIVVRVVHEGASSGGSIDAIAAHKPSSAVGSPEWFNKLAGSSAEAPKQPKGAITAQNIPLVLGRAGTVIKSLFRGGFVDAIKISGMLAAVLSVAEVMTTALEPFIRVFTPFLKVLGTLILIGLMPLLKLLVPILSSLMAAGAGIAGGASGGDLGSSVVSLLTGIGGLILTVLTLNAVTGAVAGLSGAIVSLFTWLATKTGITGAIETAVQLFGVAIDLFWGWMTTQLSISAVWSTAASGFSAAVTAFFAWLAAKIAIATGGQVAGAAASSAAAGAAGGAEGATTAADLVSGGFDVGALPGLTLGAGGIAALGATQYTAAVLATATQGLIQSALNSPEYISSVASQVQSLMTPHQFGGVIPATAPYMLHAGERVMTADNPSNAGGGDLNLTLNYTGDGNSSDLRAMARELASYYKMYQSSRTSSSGMYGGR